MEKFTLKTQNRCQIIDITPQIIKILQAQNLQSGIITVYSPHTTAAISVNENYDPDVKHDLIHFMNKIVPQDPKFAHAEGNSDSHIKSGMFNFSQTFIVENGQLQLGQWQGVYFMEFDGPRNREVWIKTISDT